MVGREACYQGPALRDMLSKWNDEGSVNALSSLQSKTVLTINRVVGFEELGNNDAFTTAVLELRLSVSGRSLYKILGVCCRN